MPDARCLFCLVLLLVVAAPFARAQTPPPATQPVTLTPAERADEWWQQRHAAVAKRVSEGGVDLLMIGDSITQGWEEPGRDAFSKYYGSRRVANLGFSGDGTQHVLWRLANGEMENINPKLAVIMIGTNNAATCAAEDIAAGIEAIVGHLRKRLPHTQVLLLAIFPRGARADDPLRQKVAAVNGLLAERFGPKSKGADAKVHFLDIGATFVSADGSISKELMPDFLHLTPRAYELWAAAIEPHVAALLK